MCGIAGWFSNSDGYDEVYPRVQKMISRLRHRGPDDQGIEVVGSLPVVVLGQARLSIIDISPDGHQPMHDPETGNVIVFNGEIYNFKLLRAELEAVGFEFRTHSDTEVLLKAYARWGSECCCRLRGIFAFAIWDKRAQQLFVARDHMGVKPLYYCQPAGAFVFASEVRALLAGQAAERHIDLLGLNSYLAYGSVQEPYTLIKGVRSLPAGHYGAASSQGFKVAQYWSPPTGGAKISDNGKRSKADVYQEVADVLKESVSLQMIADVPLGAFLSGGIDSSAIVSLMRQTHSGPVKTFAIVFDTPEYDERRYAAQVAKQNGTEHFELELTGELAKSNLSKALQAFDQPSMDGLNTWFVSKLVKDAGLTVALSGIGGDELFVGYGGFRKPLSMMSWQKWVGRLPRFLGEQVADRARSEKVRKFGQLMGFPLPAYFLSRQVFSPSQSERLLQSGFCCGPEEWRRGALEQTVEAAKGLDAIDQISFYEMRSYMLSTLLRDTDQMSMAHSLEVRVPLIDHQVVDKMLAVPSQWKKEGASPKSFLVNAAGTGLPATCVHRPKQGFVLPFEAWFKGTMQNDIETFCHNGGSLIFDVQGLRDLWQQYQLGQITWSRIWGLFVLNHWLQEHGVS